MIHINFGICEQDVCTCLFHFLLNFWSFVKIDELLHDFDLMTLLLIHVSFLFQLDSGSPEKICLTSRDEQSVLVVSYAELKQNFERAFSELLSSGQSHASYT